MADATMLDAPETPAPLFAWKALKGVFLGSPDDDGDENKENAPQAKSPPKMRARITDVLSISPSPSKRRRINQFSSPSKSILRTPGVPTPRRQNANVTFKDVRISVSPELKRNVISPVTARSESKETKPEILSKPVTIGNVKRKISSLDATTEDAVLVQATVPSSIPSLSNTAAARFNFESYKASTEKEMKKLVRYGQQMREYACMQDQENAKLKVALENLRKENEELKKREKRRELRRLSQNEGREVSDSTTTNENSQPIVKAAQVAGVNRKSSVDIRETKMGRGAATMEEEQNSRASAGFQAIPQGRRTATEGFLEDHKSHNKSNDKPLRQTSARLPPERLAAARERVRLKAAERRKASEVGSQSQSDWAGL